MNSAFCQSDEEKKLNNKNKNAKMMAGRNSLKCFQICSSLVGVAKGHFIPSFTTDVAPFCALNMSHICDPIQYSDKHCTTHACI